MRLKFNFDIELIYVVLNLKSWGQHDPYIGTNAITAVRSGNLGNLPVSPHAETRVGASVGGNFHGNRVKPSGIPVLHWHIHARQVRWLHGSVGVGMRGHL